MRNVFTELYIEMITPSLPNESNYLWAAIAATHGLMGAAVVCLLPASFWLSLGLSMAYLAIKEGGDLHRGGGFSDGLVDTFFVSLGLFSPLIPFAPAVILACVAVGVVLRSCWQPLTQRITHIASWFSWMA